MRSYIFQDTTSLVKWLRLSMIMWLIVVVMMLVVEFIYTNVIYHSSGMAEAGVAYRLGGPSVWEMVVVTFFPVVKILISLQWSVFMYLWVYTAHQNNWAMGIQKLEYTPAMSVMWFLIPVVNMFYPFMVLSEMFKASDPSTDTPKSSLSWTMNAPPSMLMTWWLGWLLIAPLAMPPFLARWLLGGLGPIPFRLAELGLYTFQVVLMFMLWRMAEDHREMQQKKYALIFPDPTVPA